MESCFKEAYRPRYTTILNAKGYHEDRMSDGKHNGFSVPRCAIKIGLLSQALGMISPGRQINARG